MAQFKGCGCITCGIVNQKLAPLVKEIAESLIYAPSNLDQLIVTHSALMHGLMPLMSQVLDDDQFILAIHEMRDELIAVARDVLAQDGRLKDIQDRGDKQPSLN